MAGRPKRTADLAVLGNFRPAQAQQIYESIGAGDSLGSIAEAHGVGRWALTTWLEDPARVDLYKRARVRAASALAEKTIEIADNAAAGTDGDAPAESDVARDKLRIQARQWLSSRWDRETYGDRANTSVVVNMATLHIDALRRAGPVAPEVKVIEGKAE